MHRLRQGGFQITWVIDTREPDEVSIHFPCTLYPFASICHDHCIGSLGLAIAHFQPSRNEVDGCHQLPCCRASLWTFSSDLGSVLRWNCNGVNCNGLVITSRWCSCLKVFSGSIFLVFQKGTSQIQICIPLRRVKESWTSNAFCSWIFFESLWHLDGRIFGREKWKWNCRDVEADSGRPYSYGEPWRGAIRGIGSTSGPPSVHRTLANTFQVQSERSRNWENRSFL